MYEHFETTIMQGDQVFKYFKLYFLSKAVVLFNSEILSAGRIYMQYFCFWNNNIIINKSFEDMNLFYVTEMGLILGGDTVLFFNYVKWVLSVKQNKNCLPQPAVCLVQNYINNCCKIVWGLKQTDAVN